MRIDLNIKREDESDLFQLKSFWEESALLALKLLIEKGGWEHYKELGRGLF